MSSIGFLNVLFNDLQGNARGFQKVAAENKGNVEVTAQLNAQKTVTEKAITEVISSVYSTISAWIAVSREAQQLGRG
jgi:hypothetical protein